MSRDLVMPEPSRPTKRIVLRHPSGLHQILGHTVEQPPAFLELQRATIDGKSLPLTLVAAKPRYYLFTVPNTSVSRPPREAQG